MSSREPSTLAFTVAFACFYSYRYFGDKSGFPPNILDLTMQSVRDLINTAYAAFNRRDIDAVLALMHPDVDWPNGMDGGRVHGHDHVRNYWTMQWTRLDPHVDPVSIEQNETGHTVVEVHQVVRDLDGNLLIDQMVQHVYLIHDGLIERMDIRNPA